MKSSMGRVIMQSMLTKKNYIHHIFELTRARIINLVKSTLAYTANNNSQYDT